jgi:hypothetical protein
MVSPVSDTKTLLVWYGMLGMMWISEGGLVVSTLGKLMSAKMIILMIA